MSLTSRGALAGAAERRGLGVGWTGSVDRVAVGSRASRLRPQPTADGWWWRDVTKRGCAASRGPGARGGLDGDAAGSRRSRSSLAVAGTPAANANDVLVTMRRARPRGRCSRARSAWGARRRHRPSPTTLHVVDPAGGTRCPRPRDSAVLPAASLFGPRPATSPGGSIGPAQCARRGRGTNSVDPPVPFCRVRACAPGGWPRNH